jgi:chromosome segregation ATPase
MTTKAKRTEVGDLKKLVRTLAKDHAKLRLSFASTLGTVERLDDECDALRAENKELKAKVKRLIADPIYAVPRDLKQRVDKMEETLPLGIKALHVKMTSKAAQEDLDEFISRVKHAEAAIETAGETAGDLHDRLVLLEDAATAPHASPPTLKEHDPRQTTLDDAIAKTNAEMDQPHRGHDEADDAEEPPGEAVAP